MNWRTSTFGLIGAIGTAVVGAMAMGLIDPADLPKWVRGVAALMMVIGGAGTGFTARDASAASKEHAALSQKVEQTQIAVRTGDTSIITNPQPPVVPPKP